MMSMPEMQVADVQMQFMQRPNQRLGLGAPPKMRTKGPPARKTPFMLLNEHYPLLSRLINIEDVSASTTGHRFRCTATIAEKMFVGEGSNKKEAKQAMAERAVHDLLPHLAGSLANYAPVPPPVNFASSDHHDYDMNFDGSADITASFPQTDNAASQQVPKVAPESQHESPLAKLKRLCAEREAADGVKYSPQFECVDISPPEAKPHEKIFKCESLPTYPPPILHSETRPAC
uniref:DRBM domain-containing protein n=1 Tax=Plectus sambesii TaxID=2011161 RepID=A0A914X4S4_9BILA